MIDQKLCDHKWDGKVISGQDSACVSCSLCGVGYFDFINGIYGVNSRQPRKSIYYFWIGKKTGYAISSTKESPRRKGEKLKYMGFSSDVGWPKKMNTGRVMYKPK